jgi:Raf kinase inhibitor-like YbhB/YbcL family protein
VACDGADEPEAKQTEELQVTTLAFTDGSAIPEPFTCDGSDVSPALRWEDAEAAEYVVTVTDPDADDFAHWIVYGIPGDVHGLAEGRVRAGAIEGTNGFDKEGYGGPCPPEGDEPHRYEFTVYALDETSTARLAEGASLEDVLSAIECCVVRKGTLTGTYGR